MSNVPSQYTVAQTFITNVINQYNREISPNPPTLTFTGHSLGAVIAELSAVKEDVKAVTFDSPGSVEVINTMIANNQLLAGSVEQAANLFTCYNAAPNFINTINTHAGTVNRVYPSYQIVEGPTLGGYWDFTLPPTGQHSMDGIAAQFNEVTGQPKVVTDMTGSWPVGSLLGNSFCADQYATYATNPHYWDLYLQNSWASNSPSLLDGQSPVQQVYGSFADYQKDVITGFLGGYGTPSAPGVTINIDNSGNVDFGATQGTDTHNGGTGNDVHYPFSGHDQITEPAGDDTYITANNRVGKLTISDTNGYDTLLWGGAPITGTASPVTNRPTGTAFTLDISNSQTWQLTLVDNTGTPTATGSNLLMNYVNDDQTLSSVTLNNFKSGMFGINLPSASATVNNEFQIATNISNIQLADAPVACVLNNGNIATVFIAGSSPNYGEQSIVGQIVTPSGELSGSNFLIKAPGTTSSYLTGGGEGIGLSVTPTAQGGFAVTWANWYYDESNSYTKLYDSSGNSVDGDTEHHINPSNVMNNIGPNIMSTTKTDGSIQYIWAEDTTTGFDVAGNSLNTATGMLGTQYSLSGTAPNEPFPAALLGLSTGKMLDKWGNTVEIRNTDNSLNTRLTVNGSCPAIAQSQQCAAELSDGTIALINSNGNIVSSLNTITLKLYDDTGQPAFADVEVSTPGSTGHNPTGVAVGIASVPQARIAVLGQDYQDNTGNIYVDLYSETQKLSQTSYIANPVNKLDKLLYQYPDTNYFFYAHPSMISSGRNLFLAWQGQDHNLHGTIISPDTILNGQSNNPVNPNLIPDAQGNVGSTAGTSTLNGSPGLTTYQVNNFPDSTAIIRDFQQGIDTVQVNIPGVIDPSQIGITVVTNQSPSRRRRLLQADDIMNNEQLIPARSQKFQRQLKKSETRRPRFLRRLLQADNNTEANNTFPNPLATGNNAPNVTTILTFPGNITGYVPGGNLTHSDLSINPNQLPSSGGGFNMTEIIAGAAGGAVLLLGVCAAIIYRGPIGRGVRHLFSNNNNLQANPAVAQNVELATAAPSLPPRPAASADHAINIIPIRQQSAPQLLSSSVPFSAPAGAAHDEKQPLPPVIPPRPNNAKSIIAEKMAKGALPRSPSFEKRLRDSATTAQTNVRGANG